MTSLAPLFEPFVGGGLNLRNRIAMAPMTRWKSPNEMPGTDVAAYYARRAANDVGLVITEGTTIDHPVSSSSLRIPAFHGPALGGWRRVVEAVHEQRASIVPQLWHVGAMRRAGSEDVGNREEPSVSPSGLYKPASRPIHEPMTRGQIRQVVDSFARAAAAARELDFDGIEIHGAHGYLVDQFLWEGLNTRADEYGGDSVERTRFASELVAAIRSEVGPDYAVIFRISQWKQQDYKARLAQTPEELGAILEPLVAAGVSVFDCSQRRYWEPEFEGSHLNFAGWTRRLTGLPVITVGSVGLDGAMSTTDLGEGARVSHDLGPLAEGLASHEFDIVAVGRALLSDPEWAKKVKQERWDQLQPYRASALETLV